jgi:hypothetical protein
MIKTREREDALRRGTAAEGGEGASRENKIRGGRHEEEAKGLTFAFFSPNVESR